MREEFDKLVAVGKIGRHHVEPLVALAEHGYCLHRSWGFGRIRQVDTVFGRFIVDFQGKANHSMDLAFAAESLQPIDRDHILARKAEDLAGLREMAALHHLDLIKLVLNSLGGQATVDRIQEALVPDVVDADWKKWWEAAKREMRKDGHFLVPMKKSEPIVYQAQEVSLRDRILVEFRAAKGLKARLIVASEFLKNLGDLGDDRRTTLIEAANLLSSEIASHRQTLPALALEGIFMRDDLRAAAEAPAAEGDVTDAMIWAEADSPGRLLEQVAAAKHKRALESFKNARPDTWATTVLGFMNHVGTRLCTECAHLLIQEGHLGALKSTVARLISQHTASSELLLWLAKDRSNVFADILGPEVFRAMLTAIERDQFNEKKANRLRDFILDDTDLLVSLIETADREVIKDLTRTLQLSPSFDDMDKRSLLARIVKHSPVVQSLISGDHSRQESVLVVSWESLARRKAEYDDLVHRRIPANSRDIAVARGYGDLSENHEFKAAKEAHRLLMLRKTELEDQLVRARGTDFANPRTDVVSIGTRVAVTEVGTDHQESFHILGAWDLDIEHHIISYLSPIAQSLLNKTVGDEAEFELDGHTRRYRIDAIEVSAPAVAGPGTPPPAVTGTADSAPPAPAPETPGPTPRQEEPPQ
ncbi:MAG TPA: GreA/GreB family elongation factor [Verrucomicrobiota bacterium]|nr:GreA/GreB family elongation factor [Verrucomicrobiota bacterium]HNU50811.1 GreA/GreB family elongation factor [Verrucomicrobiota bacterium]